MHILKLQKQKLKQDKQKLKQKLKNLLKSKKELRQKEKLQPYLDCSWLVLQDGLYRPTTEGLLHADGMAATLFI